MEELINPFAAAHGDYVQLAEFGEARNAKVNRGGTAIERWLHADPPVFSECERSAIRYCRTLWQRIDKKGPPDLSGIPGDMWIGQSEHDALADLATIKRRFPPKWWDCYEGVCRFELDAPLAGRLLANSSRSASDAAKTCTAFVAGMIALWEGYT